MWYGQVGGATWQTNGRRRLLIRAGRVIAGSITISPAMAAATIRQLRNWRAWPAAPLILSWRNPAPVPPRGRNR